ncbi:hypothetical protein Ocin01_18094, partial [Orchesella cincta]
MYKWSSDVNAYQRKLKSKVVLTKEHIKAHPLEKPSSQIISIKHDPLDGLDPLSICEMDPLTRMASDLYSFPEISSRPLRDSFEPWSVKKAAILHRFTTQEKMTITTSVFAAEHEVRGVSEKVLHRLEQLDLDCGSKQTFGGLSQEEYTFKINQLDQQLTQAWNSDLRVNALKIAIQCCKLLGDTSVISFYPSKFVIITDILDKFGEMVYSRLRGKQSDILPPEVAKETCKNWFYKVGSIRELLPRLAIELAILKSYSFIVPNPEYGKILIRLLNSAWGIGDPVVAIYLRCYLCRVAMELVPEEKELYMKCFQDLLLLHDQVLDNFRHSPQLVNAKVSMETYMSVLTPAVDWILQCLVHRGEHLNYTMQLVSNVPPFWKSVLTSSVLNTFPPSFIGDECLNVIEMCMTLETNISEILRNLGHCLILVEMQPSQAREVWIKVWPQIKKIPVRNAYLSCCQVWVEFVVKSFGTDTVGEFLDDVLTRVSYRNAEQFHSKLATIVEKLTTFCKDITELLKLNKFVKIVTMLNVEAAKNVMVAYASKHSEPLSDNIIINTLMHLASILHDSVDALTPTDEVKQIGGLINTFILRVNYGKDFEKQLQFYDESRGTFMNIDAVLVQLVQCVCRLGMDVGNVVGGHHTKRTRGFLSACIAYAFITIPSLDSIYTQLQLYKLTAEVAYSNQCVSQGDACLKAAITLLSEEMEEMEVGEPLIIDYVSNLLSTLLAVPDHPKESMLYLLKALMTIQWTSPILPLRFLSLLGAYAQGEYPYQFVGVDNNNSLYGCANQFIAEIDSLAGTILNDLLSKIKAYGDQNQIKKQARLSLELFFAIINWGEIHDMGNLAVNLWNFSHKNLE